MIAAHEHSVEESVALLLEHLTLRGLAGRGRGSERRRRARTVGAECADTGRPAAAGLPAARRAQVWYLRAARAAARHPQLFLSEPKEPKFFLTDGPRRPTSVGGPGDVPTWGEHVWQRDEYEALFAAAPAGARCGESTVFYLYDRDAHRRIRELVPDARLVAVLRDPVERAHSNWAHLRGAGLEPEADFATALDREPERIAAGWAHFWHYAAQGRYGEQLEHLFRLFPREQVLLIRYRELRDEPAETVDRCAGSSGSTPA